MWLSTKQVVALFLVASGASALRAADEHVPVEPMAETRLLRASVSPLRYTWKAIDNLL